MVCLNKLFAPYNEARPFHHLVNLYGYIDDETLLTKSGDPLSVLSIMGPDAESLDPADLDLMVARMASAMRAFEPGFTVTSYWVKTANPSIAKESHHLAFIDAALRNRRSFLLERSHRLFTYQTYLVVTCKTRWRVARKSKISDLLKRPRRFIGGHFSTPPRAATLDEHLNQARKSLQQAVKSFIEQCRDTFEVRVLDRNESFKLLRRQLNPNQERADAVSLKYSRHVDFQAVGSELTCHRNHLRLGESFIKVLTVKEPPAHSFADMWRELTSVSANLRVTSEWRPLDNTKVIGDIRSKRRHHHNGKVGLSSQVWADRPSEREMLFDDSREALAADLGHCLEEIEMKGTQIGEWSHTFVVQGPTLEGVEAATAEIFRIVGAHEGALTDESYNILNAFLATLPGGGLFNLRRLLVTDKNHADLGIWFVPSTGEARNELLDGPSLITLETEQNSLYDFNLHAPGQMRDVAHTAVLGMTGVGKSFFLNAILTHVEKYLPFTIIFDVGGSYRSFVRALDASYISVGKDKVPFSINIFAFEPTPENRQFQFAFSRLLIESAGYRMTEKDQKELFDGIEALAVLGRRQQRLRTLATTLSPSLGKHLTRWTEGEQYGAWFDHIEDTVYFTQLQCIDFEGIESIGEALEPLQFYLLHRANEAICDPSRADQFKICIVDEAWRFCRNSVTRSYIEAALRTWRKKNAAMVLATQSLDELTEELRPVLDNCPTKILMANPTLDSRLYGDVLRLTPGEQETVRNLIPKRQFLLKQGQTSKVLNLNVDPSAVRLYTMNSHQVKRRDEALANGEIETAFDFITGDSR